MSPREAGAVELDVGPALRRAREERGLSLRSVATAVGVSASLISQVENGKTQPSVSTLYALVNHLGISLDGLLIGAPVGHSLGATASGRRTGRSSDAVVQRAEDNPRIEMENGVVWERLAVGDSAVADPLLVTYEPGGSSSVEGKMMRHAALEYGVILEGRLTMKLDFETYDLEPGDSFCFDANRPHLYVNQTERPARGIWFVIGRREMSYQSLADLGHEEQNDPRQIASAVDVLQAMKSFRDDARG